MCYHETTDRRDDPVTEQEIERDMYARAVALIEERYPTGWGGAAVLRAED